MHDSLMSKTSTIEEDGGKLPSPRKRGQGASLANTGRHNERRPLETCGELLDAYEENPMPHKANLEVLRRIERERGKRSGGRK